MNSWVFDVDGTLTPSRQKMNEEFRNWFFSFCGSHNVYLVTGSDREKTIEQVGVEVYNACKRVYNCSGNDVWEQDTHLYTNKLNPSQSLIAALESNLESSEFSIRTGNHIEERPGLINFSIVGRNATLKERATYVKWDNDHLEREKIAKTLETQFTEYDFSIAGETGIDITRKGLNKSQIVKDFPSYLTIRFFGDRMLPGGNDMELGIVIGGLPKGYIYPVKGWENTWDLLKNITSSVFTI